MHRNFNPDCFYFTYTYKAEEGGWVRIRYSISDDWIERHDRDLPIEIDENISKVTEFTSDGSSIRPAWQNKLKQYATLFYQKTENYFKKTNRIILGRSRLTKLIRITADQLNQREQILLNKSALLSRSLEDLLK